MSAVPSAVLLDSSADSGDSTDLLGSQYSQWAIYATGTSDAAIDPDSFVGIEFRGEARISDYPVEQGAFDTYNKVQVPSEIRVKLACANEAMPRGDFLSQLKAMKEGIDIYDISTPDFLYESFNLIHYDYTRRSKNGVSMIVADCWFEEVRQTGSASFSASGNGSAVQSDSPSANDPVNSGTVSATDPTAAQSAAVGNPPVVQ